MDELEVIYDITNKELTEVPAPVLQMHSLKMLYLDKNQITLLPENIFEALPNLTWLDLRDNRLEAIPRTIGQHKRLENLLVQNNQITHLPAELSCLTTLKVLQLSDNPLVYPPPEVVDCGLDDIMIFLQQDYNKKEKKPTSMSSTRSASSMSSGMLVTRAKNRTESGTIQLEVLPTLMENTLAERILKQRQLFLDDRCNHGKVHNVIKTGSKTTVRSYYKNMNVRNYLPAQDKRQAEQVKQDWLEKLQELVADQEKILHQEKTMGALKNWRKEKSIALRQKPILTKSPPPFDTNPAFNAYMSREDVTADVSKALKEQEPTFSKDDINTMIQDIMSQMQTARDKLLQSETPADRVQNAEDELKLVMAVHKKISNMQKPHFI